MINSEKENKKAAADALRWEIAYSRHVYSRIVLFVTLSGTCCRLQRKPVRVILRKPIP